MKNQAVKENAPEYGKQYSLLELSKGKSWSECEVKKTEQNEEV